MTESASISLAWVREQKAKHRAAIADLDATERVLMARAAEEALRPAAPPSVPPQKGYGTKKLALLGVIADSKPNGLTTQGVIAAGKKLGLENLKTENVSPKLSDYKSSGLLELRDGLWHITAAGSAFLVEAQKNRGQP